MSLLFALLVICSKCRRLPRCRVMATQDEGTSVRRQNESPIYGGSGAAKPTPRRACQRHHVLRVPQLISLPV